MTDNTKLGQLLARRIATTGPLTMAEFMAEALGHPEFGYYMAREPFGAQGDFITAPEISQMFGELCGLWLADQWDRMGRPTPVRLIELGPGRGSLMRDCLRAMAAMPGLTQALTIHLIEMSPRLRQIQEKTLAGYPVQWVGGLDDVPEGPVLIIANEFFDALPIRQFRKGPGGFHERLVTVDASGKLMLAEAQAPVPAAALGRDGMDVLADGTVVEICPAGEAIAAQIGAKVAKGGAALIIDYGMEDGVGDSFQALRNHAFADPLARVGEQDLTAHVDFHALAKAAMGEGAKAHGPVGQGAFLTALGITRRAAALRAKATPAQSADIAAAVTRLTAHDAMGDLFKVLALTDSDAPPPGF